MSHVGFSFHFEWMAASLALGYLLGSIPFGLFFTFLSGAGDVRKIGSGNIGATNVLRTGKKWAAAATLLCDGAKGAVAVLLARHFLDGYEAFAAAGAVLGHIFPVWLKFKGGKGVATYLGVCFGLYWPVGLLVAATWLGAALIWRISSLSALIAIALPAVGQLVHPEAFLGPVKSGSPDLERPAPAPVAVEVVAESVVDARP